MLVQKLQQFLFASYPGGEEEKIRQRVCGRKYHIFNHIVTSFFLAGLDKCHGSARSAALLYVSQNHRA